MVSHRRPGPGLLFDELLPWRVAAALRILEFKVSHVGMEEEGTTAPPRGSSDEEVLQHARRRNQFVVTSDLGMILLCTQAGQSVIWIDPRARQLRREETVLLVFKQIHDWEEHLRQADGPICLRAMRTTTHPFALDEAARIVHNRMKQISAPRKARKRTTPPGPLFPQDEEADGG